MEVTLDYATPVTERRRSGSIRLTSARGVREQGERSGEQSLMCRSELVRRTLETIGRGAQIRHA